PAVNSRPQAAPRQMVTEGREPRDPVGGAGRPKGGRTGCGETRTRQSAGQRADGGAWETEGRSGVDASLARGPAGARRGGGGGGGGGGGAEGAGTSRGGRPSSGSMRASRLSIAASKM